jgi:hypothetical protein
MVRLGYAAILSIIMSTAYATHIGAAEVLPAPTGNPITVATRIIKANWPECKLVTSAVRSTSDGSINAVCDGYKYMVFVVVNNKTNELMEVAMNCANVARILKHPVC